MARRHDALIPLSHDHRSALALAFRLHNPAPPGPVTPTTPASTPAGRARETLEFFRDSLIAHFAIEEELLFPALRSAGTASGADPELLDELIGDHRELARLRDRIEHAQPGRELADALTGFADLLETHVRKEERRLFATFPASLPRDTVRDLETAIHGRRPPDTPTSCKR